MILAGNHSGILDGPLVYFVSPRPCRLLTKAEVFVGPWSRPCGWLGLIPVHRGQADRAALLAADDAVHLDSSFLDAEQVVEQVLRLADAAGLTAGAPR